MAVDLAERPLELEPVAWQHKVQGELPRDVSVQLYSNENLFDASQLPDEAIVVWAGYGERDQTIQEALAFYASIGERVIMPDFAVDDVPATKRDILTYITTVGGEVFRQARERGTIGPHAIALGHSMGGGLLALSLDQVDEGTVGSIGLLEPAGISNAELRKKYPNDVVRELVVLGRLGLVLSYPFYKTPMHERTLAAKEIGGQVLHDTANLPPGKKLWNKFHPATVTLDGAPNILTHAAAGNRAVFVLGSKDPIVVPEEVIASLNMHAQGYTEEEWDVISQQIQFIITDNRHSHMIFPDGKEHFQLAMAGLRGRDVEVVQKGSDSPDAMGFFKGLVVAAKNRLIGLDEYYAQLAADKG